MTLHEIEETLATLSSRHQGLDEAMLVTLLEAGGWEEKDIKEARMLFRGGKAPSFSIEERHEELPSGEHKELPQEISADHQLLNHNPPDALPPEEVIAQKEPVSLVEVSEKKIKEELPHNLPLRPFETSEHIWPFSRYRDVFYGEEEEKVEEVKKTPPQPVKKIEVPIVAEPTSPLPPVQAPAPQEKVETISFRPADIAPVVPHTSSVSTHHKGEKLAIMALVMLLTIFFLLGYMYQNGRL